MGGTAPAWMSHKTVPPPAEAPRPRVEAGAPRHPHVTRRLHETPAFCLVLYLEACRVDASQGSCRQDGTMV